MSQVVVRAIVIVAVGPPAEKSSRVAPVHSIRCVPSSVDAQHCDDDAVVVVDVVDVEYCWGDGGDDDYGRCCFDCRVWALVSS